MGGSHTGPDFLAGFVNLRGTHSRAECSEGLYPVGGTHTRTVHEELQPVEGLMLEHFVTDCIPWERLQAKAGQGCEREGEAKLKHYD